ncbi:tRNA-Thr(GGU) m(6)t(6)A37 methyltransferase TsaA [Syntrophotalea acetylenivorans]|uniref:tRNA-Thr(GGU) m(6)t(6)A37 methyltransferase TsaA n=1 Tax=Syntrophotalea acetylenivorans TaxID=1842532 RepID=A0A1L3GRQ6_9BACT|nr:tRNA (N6-threonylcarbamoyladenosine(37)-N6)-methyltransferase TrmO [Syntrophotalea acetylenivorans]APG28632.1 tRNA-Thr(GGU) m(6)t(6)A37 methyltransferase TsaA [Syntrophotalea acetylenivorans]
MDIHFETIGIIRSCFKEKFGIPRQAGLVPAATATLELLPPYNQAEAFTGLEGFSHLWLLFLFHGNDRQSWKATVRPPRLGGNTRLGVFATRSPFRPNPIGLSAVELERIEQQSGKIILHLKGVDLLDGTPIIDIKPYLPYADAIATAKGGFAAEAPKGHLTVNFLPEPEQTCLTLEQGDYPDLRQLIVETLRNDPRPAYYQQRPQKNSFGMKLFDFDLRWEQDGDSITVTELHRSDR